MILHRSESQLRRARAMRSTPTKAEEILWRSLRGNGMGVKFRRQEPIGPYIADLACRPAMIVIELDGSPHETDEQRGGDRVLDTWFAEHGWRVLRVPNEIIFGGGDMVLDHIKSLFAHGPSSVAASPRHLLPQAGEEEFRRNAV